MRMERSIRVSTLLLPLDKTKQLWSPVRSCYRKENNDNYCRKGVTGSPQAALVVFVFETWSLISLILAIIAGARIAWSVRRESDQRRSINGCSFWRHSKSRIRTANKSLNCRFYSLNVSFRLNSEVILRDNWLRSQISVRVALVYQSKERWFED